VIDPLEICRLFCCFRDPECNHSLKFKKSSANMLGFTRIDRSELPLKIWSDCIICVKFPDCDEIAMLKEL
jgi:N-acetylglutamate synthase-like GNAT family acetyltransferase